VIPLLTERLHCGRHRRLDTTAIYTVIPLLTERLHCGVAVKGAEVIATSGDPALNRAAPLRHKYAGTA